MCNWCEVITRRYAAVGRRLLRTCLPSLVNCFLGCSNRRQRYVQGGGPVIEVIG
jgi:hypothetical protein